jgi:hypothetical protein
MALRVLGIVTWEIMPRHVSNQIQQGNRRRVPASERAPEKHQKLMLLSDGLPPIPRKNSEYIREAFGNGYRLSDANWEKLRSCTFYNPWHHRNEVTVEDSDLSRQR